MNSQKDMTRPSVGLATKSFVSFVIDAFLFQTRTDPTPRSHASFARVDYLNQVSENT